MGQRPFPALAPLSRGDGTALVPLQNKKGEIVASALVDEDMAVALCQWGWGFHRYAQRSQRIAGRHLTIYMHQVVINARSGAGYQIVVDHVNGDHLDNRRENLRVTTRSGNMQNRRGADRDSLSGVRNVRPTRGGRWAVRVRVHGREYSGGSYASLDEADAVAQTMRARLHHG